MTTTGSTSNTGNMTGSNASVIAGLQTAAASANAQVMSSSSLTGGSSSGSAGLASNLNMFLTMLTTQLTHQDPMSPSDSSQFTNQLVLYAQVEQQINTNSNLTSLISLQNTSQQASAINYIGQTVELTGTSLPLQNGTADLSYTLPSAAASAVVQIKDSSGNTVASLTGPTSAGTHYLSWNGQNSSGTQLSDGQYTISVVADDAKGNSITATSATYGKVTGVTSSSSGTAELNVGDVTSPLSGVTSIVDTTQLAASIAAGT